MNRAPLIATLSLVVAACAARPPAPEPAPGASVSTEADARVGVAMHSEHGRYLTDAQGRALYLLEQDPAMASICYDACAEAWPPYRSEGMPVAAAGADASLLDRIQRRDGTWQVTYGGNPLYYYARDAGPGSLEGYDVQDAWGEWYLVGPDGEAIEHEGHEGHETSRR